MFCSKVDFAHQFLEFLFFSLLWCSHSKPGTFIHSSGWPLRLKGAGNKAIPSLKCLFLSFSSKLNLRFFFIKYILITVPLPLLPVLPHLPSQQDTSLVRNRHLRVILRYKTNWNRTKQKVKIPSKTAYFLSKPNKNVQWAGMTVHISKLGTPEAYEGVLAWVQRQPRLSKLATLKRTALG